MSIDLSQLPPPEVIETLSFEAILAEMKADFVARWPAAADTIDLESEPVVALLETYAYRELTLRARINDAARATMLAYAQKADLDQRGANFGVPRLLIDAGDATAIPPIAPTYELDDDYRQRILLSLESYTTAGSTDSYRYHAISADGQVLDAYPASPVPGQVTVYVLSRTGDGTADEQLLDTVAAALNAEHIRPMTDLVTVLSASIVEYTIEAALLVASGPDAAVILKSAVDAAAAYAADQHRIGVDPSLSGIYRALHQPGVLRVDLAHPTGNIVIDEGQASYCTAITLTEADE